MMLLVSVRESSPSQNRPLVKKWQLELAATRERSRSGGGGVVIETFLVTLNPHFRVLNVPQQVMPSRPPSRRLRSGAPSSWRSARRQRHRQSRLRRGVLTAAPSSRCSTRRRSWSRLRKGALTATHQEAPCRPPCRIPLASLVGARTLLAQIRRWRRLVTRKYFSTSLGGASAL